MAQSVCVCATKRQQMFDETAVSHTVVHVLAYLFLAESSNKL